MSNLPDKIMQAELDLLDQTERLKANRGRLRGIEVEHSIEVADAKHDSGKPIFTNELARTAAVEKLCQDDDTYQKVLAEIRRDEHDSKVTEAVFEKLKREFREYLLDREEHVRRMDALSLREELRHIVFGGTIQESKPVAVKTEHVAVKTEQRLAPIGDRSLDPEAPF